MIENHNSIQITFDTFKVETEDLFKCYSETIPACQLSIYCFSAPNLPFIICSVIMDLSLSCEIGYYESSLKHPSFAASMTSGIIISGNRRNLAKGKSPFQFCCSVTQSCLTLGDPMDCSTPGFPVLHHLLKVLKLMSLESVMSSNHLILSHPLLLLPSIFLITRVFSMSRLFTQGGQSIGATASASVLPMNIQD